MYSWCRFVTRITDHCLVSRSLPHTRARDFRVFMETVLVSRRLATVVLSLVTMALIQGANLCFRVHTGCGTCVTSYLRLKNVRVPREAMFARNAVVTPDGRYVSAPSRSGGGGKAAYVGGIAWRMLTIAQQLRHDDQFTSRHDGGGWRQASCCGNNGGAILVRATSGMCVGACE